ncbi:MAG TPA: hypothetical protein PLR20_05770 [Syntrophales bacterium]|nr:hypothetical protein [Syntrophales bacterium]HPI57880.1 hypothetical protein [Syntrophales bacterium]HPN24538.1 hypothetical protein [Syntrophales bacterium]HQM28844.1 hypothetical protein [Syntrophales bacterium]
MKGKEATEIFKLVKAQKLLPGKLDDLVPLSFIGQAAVSYYRAKVKAMDKLGMAEEQRKATLKDGQDAGELLLDIEGRIGELLPSRDKAMTGRKGVPKGTPSKVLPEGIDHKRAHQARAISENPAVVEKIKAQARENEDIPTKTAVINAINYEKEKQRKEQSKSKASSIEDSLEAQIYIETLERVLLILPKEPPKNWKEATFERARTLAQIIIRRMDVFVEQKAEQTTDTGQDGKLYQIQPFGSFIQYVADMMPRLSDQIDHLVVRRETFNSDIYEGTSARLSFDAGKARLLRQFAELDGDRNRHESDNEQDKKRLLS